MREHGGGRTVQRKGQSKRVVSVVCGISPGSGPAPGQCPARHAAAWMPAGVHHGRSSWAARRLTLWLGGGRGGLNLCGQQLYG